VNRYLRIAVVLVLLFVGAAQIGMCAVDCNCFLPPPRGIVTRSFSGDADGCLCCAQCAHVSSLVIVPDLIPAVFAPAALALQIYRTNAPRLDRPPRS